MVVDVDGFKKGPGYTAAACRKIASRCELLRSPEEHKAVDEEFCVSASLRIADRVVFYEDTY